jgi:magnesium-transporting ATPase (P-type)
LISGSRIIEGTGYMIVLAVGANSQNGILKLKLVCDYEEQTPL